jgi:signal transduction histidine kinase
MREFLSKVRPLAGWIMRQPPGAALAVGVAYLAAAFAGWGLSTEGAFATFWPPNAVLLAALLIAPRRLWTYVVLATLPANLAFNDFAGMGRMVSLAYWMVNVLEGVGIAVVLRSLGTDLRFVRRRTRSVMELALVSIGFTALTGLLGALATLIAQPSASLLDLWASWTMGDLVAILTLTPLLVTACEALRRGGGVSRECAAFGCVLTIATLALVGALVLDSHRDYVFEPLMIPLLGWAALRLGVRGTAWAVAATTVLTIANSAFGHDQALLPDGFTPERAVAFQAVLSALSVTFLGIAAAIDDAREKEDEQRRSAAAQRAYLASVTEEIRSPLRVILGAVDSIEGQRDPHRADAFAEMRSIERAARQILDVAEEIRGGDAEVLHHPLVVDSFWLPALWRDLGEACAEVERQAGVTLDWCSPAQDVSLSSDRWRLRIVVQNLVTNALRFTERGTVTAECIAGDDALTIVVRDTGIGIARDRQRLLALNVGSGGRAARDIA